MGDCLCGGGVAKMGVAVIVAGRKRSFAARWHSFVFKVLRE